MSEFFVDRARLRTQTLFPGVTIEAASCQQMMLSDVHMDAGAVVEEHSHPHEQVGMVISGRAHFFIGDEDQILTAGDMYRIPGGVRHRVVALESEVRALDIFTPVREDYVQPHANG